MSVLDDIASCVGRVVDEAAPAVVGLDRGRWAATGFVARDGLVLTSARALRRDRITVTFADGSRREGRVRAADADADLAAVEVDTGGAPALRWHEGRPEPVLGQPVFALANPGGRGLHATFGMVSSTGRSLRGPRGRRLPAGIEHTAPLARGSGGGPLLDAGGALVGMNSARLEGGLALALPADDDLHARAERLLGGASPARLALGVAVAPGHVARRMRRAVGLPERDGLLVRDVRAGSPAEQAGLARGDLIAGAAGASVRDVDDLYTAIDARSAGDELELEVVRGLDERRVAVRLAEEE